MDSYSVPKAQQYGDYTYADFTDEEKASVARAHEALGVELTEDLIAEYESHPDPFSLTEAELAEVRTSSDNTHTQGCDGCMNGCVDGRMCRWMGELVKDGFWSTSGQR